MRGSALCQCIALGLLFCLPCVKATANVLAVGQQSYPTIGSALAAAHPGDTILISPGTYREGNLRVKTPVVILGQGMPVIDGEGKFEIFTVLANDVTIRGLHLVNTGSASVDDIAAVKGLNVQRLRVLENRFDKTFFGIHLANSSGCVVEGNTLSGTSGIRIEQHVGNGIHLWKCTNATIRNNDVHHHRDGIYFEFVTHSHVEGNYSHENIRYGLHFMFSNDDEYVRNRFRNNGAGAAVMYTKGVTMLENRFEENQGSASYALLLKDIADSKIIHCKFVSNTIGIHMEGTSRCLLRGNDFKENGWAVRIQASCDDNVLTANNFVGNTFDVATNGSLSLNKLSGNYWDKYDGYDLNRDGVGDVPFHPVSLYGMIVEKMPTSVMLWRSFLVFLLDRAEKIVPAVTPENLRDESPKMKSND